MYPCRTAIGREQPSTPLGIAGISGSVGHLQADGIGHQPVEPHPRIQTADLENRAGFPKPRQRPPSGIEVGRVRRQHVAETESYGSQGKDDSIAQRRKSILQLIQAQVVIGIALQRQQGHIGIKGLGIGKPPFAKITASQFQPQSIFARKRTDDTQSRQVSEGEISVALPRFSPSSAAEGKNGLAPQNRRGGKLSGFEFGGSGFEDIDAPAQGGQFGGKFPLQSSYRIDLFGRHLWG